MVIDTDIELKRLNDGLQKIKDSFEAMKKSGVSEDILIAYMCFKLHKSQKEMKKMLDCQEEFYDKLVKRMTIKKLKEE